MPRRSLLVVAPHAPKPLSAAECVVAKPKARRDAVIGFIRSARTSFLLSIFRCNDLAVLRELGEAVARGVRVEALLTGRAKGWGKRLEPLAGCLERMGVVVHRYSRGDLKYHAKYMVADGGAALIGTLNFTRRCFRRTRDFLLVSRDPALVAGLIELFRADAAGADLAVGGRLIVGPEDSRERIERLLGEAQRSIRILDHKLSDPGILAILRDRQRKGVLVEVESGDTGSRLVPHGKLIIVDHATAVFGSIALSARSLDERRELAVVIQEPALVAKLDRQFDKALRPAAAIGAAA